MFYRSFYLVCITAGLLLGSGCAQNDSATKRSANHSDSASTDSLAQLRDVYSNPEYDIALRMPNSWILVEEPQKGTDNIGINLFKRGTGAEQELPLSIHSKAPHSYIAIWPRGLGTELPAGKRRALRSVPNSPNLSFEIDTSKSRVLQLEDGTTWGYFIVPQTPPQHWSKNGFIFAQIQVNDQKTICLDEKTGKQLSMKECDSLEGDQFIRKGNRNEQDAAVIHNILESLSLKEIKKKKAAEDMISIQKPAPNMDIRSPLKIKGKAKGYWYFEGSFSIKLYDAYDNLLADTVAHAEGDWTTDNFVPFEATIKFDAPDDERGELVFERANPSGLPQKEQSYSQPVIFPPKE